MVIASRSFLLLFFPISLIIYWYIARSPRQKLLVLLLISLLFYSLAGNAFVFLLLFLSVSTYWLAKRKKFFLGILINLFALGVFKYWGFGIENINHITKLLGLQTSPMVINIILPLGISFYIFKHIGYLLDVRSNRYPASNDIFAFITYTAYFPQIIAGPLTNYQDSAKQFEHLPTRLNTEQVYSGILHISSGLAKKILIADVLIKALDGGFYSRNTPGTGMIWAWLSIVIFCFEIYFDFSGYTDFVIGISKLFGITLPPNFDNPYLASNINQFWQRWHISLSTWFRIYLYLPLSRSLIIRFHNKSKILPQIIANLVSMSLIGLWHGASWTYIIWGVYHGTLLSIHSIGNQIEVKIKSQIFNRGLTITAIILGWAIFMSPNLTTAGTLLANMVGNRGLGDINVVLALYDKYTIATLLIAIFMTAIGYIEAKNLPQVQSIWITFLWGILFVLCLLQMGPKVEFIYMLF
jgi:alginate O-acetyltransferase complex protein AlgI